MARTIIHADLDAFYASVEQLDRPELRGKPVVVGGPPEARGVVAAASYEARRFGVHSATPMSRALRLCPQAVRVSPRFDRYGEVSRQVMDVYRTVTPLVEPLSLDEAFLDVTEQVARYGGPAALARHLKAQVKRVTGLTVSVGVGGNKSVAKIASDLGKPDGLVIVPPGHEASFLEALPVRALWGIGPKAEAALAAAGIRTLGQLAAAGALQMESLFGSRAPLLQRMAQGLDERPVEPVHERKSVGAETTFPRDLPHGPELRGELARLAAEVARRLMDHGFKARTVSIKLRYADVRTITRQTSRAEPTCDQGTIQSAAEALLAKTARPEDRFRLLGIHCSGLAGGGEEQLGLWET
ncbi:MAG: DNA polymerase IV [Chloroflexi bacterium]|nr:DNA polymerase IV [Chloroflexota bacterium]